MYSIWLILDDVLVLNVGLHSWKYGIVCTLGGGGGGGRLTPIYRGEGCAVFRVLSRLENKFTVYLPFACPEQSLGHTVMEN